MITVIGEITADTLKQYFDQIRNYYDKPEFVLRLMNSASILISSPGGDIGYTLAMLDDIDKYKRDTCATGICQSAAAVLATAGEGHRSCTMDALFRFIPPEKEQVLVDGEWVEKVPDLRHFLHSVLVTRLAQRLKWAIPETNDLFDGEFINSERAKELGLIDEVISTENPNGNLSRVSGCETGAYHAENA